MALLGGGTSGAALRRMQELAQSLYDSTPGLQEGKRHLVMMVRRDPETHLEDSGDGQESAEQRSHRGV
jgi:hypothetical protein